MRWVYLAAGFLFLGLAAVGAFLPVMPSTIFVILAAGCFARSSPALERRLLDHPTFGPALVRWRERGAIARPAKAMALAGMAFGFVLFLYSAEPGPLLAVAVAAILAGCAAFVASRPEA